MITTNSIKQNLYNGDMGLLIKKSKGLAPQEGDVAIFEDRKIPALILPNFEYAFCLSVHKSQGSEFDHVLLLMPEGSERFGREMVYTAVTRARKTFNLWSTKELFHKTSKQQSKRLSRIG
jgi:exodeoxyribonuclease V alpha subunit